MIEYTPTTPATAEAFDYGYGKGIEDALGELYELFGTDLEATSLWKEYIEKGDDYSLTPVKKKKYVFVYSYDHEYDKTPVVKVFDTEVDKSGREFIGKDVEYLKFTESDCHWIDNREGRTFLGQSSWYEVFTTEDNWQTQFPETIVQKLESLPQYERLEL